MVRVVPTRECPLMPMLTKPRVYTASKVHRAPMWRELREEYSHKIVFTSSWINDDITPMDEADEAKCKAGWTQNLDDCMRSDFLICYAEKDDALCGTLVEIGAVIGRGGIAFLCGECHRFCTWKHSPGVVILRKPFLDYAMMKVLDYWEAKNR